MVGSRKACDTAFSLFSLSLYDLGVLAAGVTQGDGHNEEVSRFAPQEGFYRKFVVRDGKLVGAVIIEKGLNRKAVKPLLREALLQRVQVDERQLGLLMKLFDFTAFKP